VPFFLPVLLAARAFKPDLIRVHSPYCLGLAALAVGRLFEIPTVACFHHSFEEFRGARWTEKSLMSRFTHVVTVSEFSKTQLVRLDERTRDKVSVVYAGVSKKFRPQQGDTLSWKCEHGLPVDKPLFVTVGSLIPRKNIGFLIDLMAAWILGGNRGILVIVGDGPEHANLQRKISQCGLAQRIRLWNSINDETLVSLLQAASLFLFPSLMEGFGLAPAEALACGTPAIVSDRGALPEIVRHGQTGFVLPIDRGYEPWLEAMRVLVSDPDRRFELAAAAVADIRDRFDWDRAAHQVIEVYERVVRKVRSRKAIGGMR
jgi:glycosyltransferase involved in cell wall biosynthesis